MLLRTEHSQQPQGIAVLTRLSQGTNVDSDKAFFYNNSAIGFRLHNNSEDIEETLDQIGAYQYLGRVLAEDTTLFLTVDNAQVGSPIKFNALDGSQPNARDIVCHVGRNLAVVSVVIELKTNPAGQEGNLFWQVTIEGVSSFDFEEATS